MEILASAAYAFKPGSLVIYENSKIYQIVVPVITLPMLVTVIGVIAVILPIPVNRRRIVG